MKKISTERTRPRHVEKKCVEGKRSQILEAAVRIFSQKSYFDATLEEISEASGVKKSTIYYYFGSKLDLMLCLVEELMKKAQEQVTQIEVKDKQKSEILGELVESYFFLLKDNRDYFLVFQRAGYDFLHHPEVQKKMQSIFNRHRVILQEAGEKVGKVKTRGGMEVTGEVLIRIMNAGMWGYYMEEMKKGKDLSLYVKDVFREIFTSFVQE